MPWSGRHPSRRPFFAVGTALGQDAAAKAQRVSNVARLPQVTVVKLHLSFSRLLGSAALANNLTLAGKCGTHVLHMHCVKQSVSHMCSCMPGLRLNLQQTAAHALVVASIQRTMPEKAVVETAS